VDAAERNAHGLRQEFEAGVEAANPLDEEAARNVKEIRDRFELAEAEWKKTQAQVEEVDTVLLRLKGHVWLIHRKRMANLLGFDVE
jgi:hypothetical protein